MYRKLFHNPRAGRSHTNEDHKYGSWYYAVWMSTGDFPLSPRRRVTRVRVNSGGCNIQGLLPSIFARMAGAPPLLPSSGIRETFIWYTHYSLLSFLFDISRFLSTYIAFLLPSSCVLLRKPNRPIFDYQLWGLMCQFISIYRYVSFSYLR